MVELLVRRRRGLRRRLDDLERQVDELVRRLEGEGYGRPQPPPPPLESRRPRAHPLDEKRLI